MCVGAHWVGGSKGELGGRGEGLTVLVGAGFVPLPSLHTLSTLRRIPKTNFLL